MSLDAAYARAQRLREHIRAFAAELPADLRQRCAQHAPLGKGEYVRWMRLLQARGWATAHWPRAHGGQDWSALERFVFEDELARLGLPWVIPFGVKYVAPVIYTHGSAWQQQRFLPPIAESREWWAQGYSEPGAGSDLAALQTRAERDGDDYLVNGQKIWTTYAQWADWIFCLVRTAQTPRPQSGISFLLIDMRSPGIRVKPIATMDGYHHVNEVWFENVRVPVIQRVGEENQGWRIAKFLLVNERTAGAIVGMAWAALQRLRELVDPQDAAGRRQLLELELRFDAFEAAAYAAVARMLTGNEDGAEAALIKLRGTELYQAIAETLIERLGDAGVAYDPDALHRGAAQCIGPADGGGLIKEHLYNRAATIFGGASEIQRGIVASAVFGL
jgi:alkylation response protein AidB-like acyl-CoA dehydrogenase